MSIFSVYTIVKTHYNNYNESDRVSIKINVRSVIATNIVVSYTLLGALNYTEIP